jgi:hypothetical protein
MGINFGGGDIRISDDSNSNLFSTCDLGYSYQLIDSIEF